MRKSDPSRVWLLLVLHVDTLELINAELKCLADVEAARPTGQRGQSIKAGVEVCWHTNTGDFHVFILARAMPKIQILISYR